MAFISKSYIELNEESSGKIVGVMSLISVVFLWKSYRELYQELSVKIVEAMN